MVSDGIRLKDEDGIRERIEGRTRAVASKDVDAALTHHAPDVTMFDVVNPLRYRGVDTVRERTREWFSIYKNEIGYQISDLSVTAGNDVAFAHYLYRVTGTKVDGERVQMWVRATLCFQKFGGTWKLTHEHDSVPFDPASGKASLDLVP
jgi:uncharacterized protein (TIGR02246 family)